MKGGGKIMARQTPAEESDRAELREVATVDPRVLEPATPPQFSTSLRGYRRQEVDEYVERQRYVLAAVRGRAQRAERELAKKEWSWRPGPCEQLAFEFPATCIDDDTRDIAGVLRFDFADDLAGDLDGHCGATYRLGALSSLRGVLDMHQTVTAHATDPLPDAARCLAPTQLPDPFGPGATSAIVPRSSTPDRGGAVAQRARHRHRRSRRDRLLHRGRLRRRLPQLVRYGAVSFGSIVLTELLLYLLYGLAHLASAPECSVMASVAAAIPTYVLYRRYVWKVGRRARMLQEVAPFWIVTGAGIALSTLGVAAAVSLLPALGPHQHVLRAAAVDGASILSFGVLWLARFCVLNRFVFAGAHASRARRTARGPAFSGQMPAELKSAPR